MARRERTLCVFGHSACEAWLFDVSGIKLVELREGLTKIRRRHDL